MIALCRPARLCFELAQPSDDGDLRRMLRHSPLPGQVQVTLEREPDFFAADAIEGDLHQTMLARDVRGNLVGMGRRSVRDAWVNGQPARVGYLHQFRMSPRRRVGRDLLSGGFSFCRELHADGEAPFYLSTVVRGNTPARRLLSAHLPGMPIWTEIGELQTLALAVRRKSVPPEVQRGTTDMLPALLDCLHRNGRRFQFYPRWNARFPPGLETEDFHVVRDGDRVIGCAALWDQRSFKQSRVRGYDGYLRTWRSLINRTRRWHGLPHLPPVGDSLNIAYLSHVMVDDDVPQVADMLLRAVMQEADRRGIQTLLVGKHPSLHSIRRRWHHLRYDSILCLAHWEADAATTLDMRPPQVEVATL